MTIKNKLFILLLSTVLTVLLFWTVSQLTRLVSKPFIPKVQQVFGDSASTTMDSLRSVVLMDTIKRVEGLEIIQDFHRIQMLIEAEKNKLKTYHLNDTVMTKQFLESEDASIIVRKIIRINTKYTSCIFEFEETAEPKALRGTQVLFKAKNLAALLVQFNKLQVVLNQCEEVELSRLL